MMSMLPPYLLRLLLALIFLLGSEILFWSDPAGRAPVDWLPLLAGHVVVATIILDLFVRYRVRDLWGVMVVVGVYVVLNGLVLHPEAVLDVVPDTIISRALGGQWFIGMEMMGLFLVLLDGRTWRRRLLLLIGAISVGFFWGVWVYWFPAYNLGAYTPIILPQLYAHFFAALLPVLVVFAAVRYLPGMPSITAQALQLSVREAALVAIALALLLFARIVDGSIGGGGLVASVLLLVVFWVVLWFRGDTGKPSLLAAVLPPRPLAWWWMGFVLVVFCGMALVGVQLPLANLFGFNQFTLLTLVFTGVGVGWIPLLAAVLGYRTFTHQMRTQVLD